MWLSLIAMHFLRCIHSCRRQDRYCRLMKDAPCRYADFGGEKGGHGVRQVGTFWFLGATVFGIPGRGVAGGGGLVRWRGLLWRVT